MPNPDIKDPLVPQQDNSVFDSIPERSWREELKFKQPASMTEPVATKSACLCGLDTNPVASPRMDIHCPKHDAPEAGGEPELLPDQVVAMIKESVDCEYGDLVGYKARLGAALVDLKLLLNSRVSQPADWLRDNEIKRLTDERNQLAQQGAELWERANPDQSAGEPPCVCGHAREQHGGISKRYCSVCPAGRCEGFQASIATAQPSPAPADEEVARARAVLAAVEIERLWQPQHTVDDCGACREYRKTIIAMIQKHCFTTTDVEQGTCTWTCEPNPDIEMWETDCNNAFQFEVGGPSENKMKFRCYCGKLLAEATKKSEASNVR